MDRSERFEVAHRNYLIFTLDLVALGAQLKSLGGGKDAILALAAIEAGNLADALARRRSRSAGGCPRGMSPRSGGSRSIRSSPRPCRTARTS